MTEPLDLEPIRERHYALSHALTDLSIDFGDIDNNDVVPASEGVDLLLWSASKDRGTLLAEVDRLHAELEASAHD